MESYIINITLKNEMSYTEMSKIKQNIIKSFSNIEHEVLGISITKKDRDFNTNFDKYFK